MISKKSVEKWDMFELELTSGRSFERPFQEVNLTAVFRKDSIVKKVDGFYDGGSTWRIRFMPEETGTYSFVLQSNNEEFNKLTGTFECTEPSAGNHGPVKVKNTFHFAYADGTPFFVMGTTAYAWTYRPEEIRKQTLESFTKYNFNKIRMLVFPKYYVGNHSDVDISYEPPVYPFAGEPKSFDFQTLVPEYFRNFEDRVMDLMKLGIEADVILFHPYDKWGIDWGSMKQEDDLLYLKYITARLSAYRNVWWSLGNEYDVSNNAEGKFHVSMERKDWDLIGAYIKSKDPYGHLISCHNIPFGIIYPDREWLTHVSYQHPDTYTLLLELRQKYQKPVINDEYQYEGNIKDEWGNSDAETTVFRHWLSAMAGGYGTHGEVFKKDGNNRDLFWSYGGTLIGESVPRLKFMKEILEGCPYYEMERDYVNTDGHNYFSLARSKEDYLIFCRYNLQGKGLWLGAYDGSSPEYEATVYDVWNCTVKETMTIKHGAELSITEWTAIRLVRK